MKKHVRQASLAISLVVFFSACKKDAKHETPPPPPPVAAVITIDSVQLQMQKVTTPVAPKNPGNYSVWFAMAGNKIYYANPSNTALSQFMLAYDISSNTFSDKKIDPNVCACGYMSQVVSDGQNLYYIANDATKYSPSTDTWAAINYPVTARDNNGEAGVLYYNSKIYFLGGRTATPRFKYYDISSNNWYNVADYLYSTSSSQLVVADNKIFALGGQDIETKFSCFTEEGNWKSLPDLPFEMPGYYSSKLVASFQNRFILALVSNKIYVYDAVKSKWKSEPIELTVNDNNLNIFSDNINVYIAGKSSANDFSLQKITLSKLPD
jgi:hypothetical protein